MRETSVEAYWWLCKRSRGENIEDSVFPPGAHSLLVSKILKVPAQCLSHSWHFEWPGALWHTIKSNSIDLCICFAISQFTCTCFEISLRTMNYLESRCGLSCPWVCCFPWNPVFPTITYISVYFLTVQLNLMAAFIYINSRFGSFNSQDVGSSGDFLVEGSKEMHGAPWNTGVLHCHLRLAAGGTVEEFSRGLWV